MSRLTPAAHKHTQETHTPGCLELAFVPSPPSLRGGFFPGEGKAAVLLTRPTTGATTREAPAGRCSVGVAMLRRRLSSVARDPRESSFSSADDAAGNSSEEPSPTREAPSSSATDCGRLPFPGDAEVSTSRKDLAPLKPIPGGHRSRRRKALIVSVLDYPHIGHDFGGDTTGCFNDAVSFADVLSEHYGFLRNHPESIRVCCSFWLREGRWQHQFDDVASVRRSINWLVKDLKPGDTAYFHFSGCSTYRFVNGTLEPCLCFGDFSRAKNVGYMTAEDLNDCLVRRIPRKAEINVTLDTVLGSSFAARLRGEPMQYRSPFRGRSRFIPLLPEEQKALVRAVNVRIDGSPGGPGSGLACVLITFSIEMKGPFHLPKFKGRVVGQLSFALLGALAKLRTDGDFHPDLETLESHLHEMRARKGNRFGLGCLGEGMFGLGCTNGTHAEGTLYEYALNVCGGGEAPDVSKSKKRKFFEAVRFLEKLKIQSVEVSLEAGSPPKGTTDDAGGGGSGQAKETDAFTDADASTKAKAEGVLEEGAEDASGEASAPNAEAGTDA